MGTVKHRLKGTAQIIGRDGDRITIKYDKSGEEFVIKFPEAFTSSLNVFEIDSELQRELDAVLQAKKETERAVQAEKEAQREKEKTQATVSGSTAKHSSKKVARVRITNAIEQSYRDYLIASGYSVETPSGKPSVVDSYIRSVKRVIQNEALTWTTLKDQISAIIPIYDKGGARELEGAEQHYTCINALRRFEDFVNNSTP